MPSLPENPWQAKGQVQNHKIHWSGDQHSDRRAMLIGLQIEGIADTLYFQFDVGASQSMVYAPVFTELKKRYPELINFDGRYLRATDFNMGSLGLTADSLPAVNFGSFPNEGENRKIMAGTIGADILEERKLLIDFKNSKIAFLSEKPTYVSEEQLQEFSFKMRKVLLPGRLNGKDKMLMWDSGASAYQLISSKKTFDAFRTPEAPITTTKGNQLNRPLQVHAAPCKAQIELGTTDLDLEEIVYVEGFSRMVKMLMYLSGMEGMLGNALFKDQIIYLDAQNEKWTFIESY